MVRPTFFFLLKIRLMKPLFIYFLLIALSVGFWPATVHAQKRKKEDREERKVQEATFYFTEAMKYFILEDMERALMLFEKSLDVDPNNAAAHFKIAEIYLDRNQPDLALSHATQAVKLGPDNKYYYLMKAEVLTKQSNFKQAAEVFEEMMAKIPGTEEYIFNLAAIYSYQGAYDKALTAYDKAEKEFGAAYEITTQKQKIYLKQNKLDKAIAEGEKLIEKYPGEPQFVMALAEMLVSNDREKDAIPYLEDLLKIAPETPEARLMLAKLYEETGNGQKSLENMQVAFSNPEVSIKLKLELVAKYLKELPDPQIEKLCDSLTDVIIQYHPEEADAYIIKGDFYNAINKPALARDFYLKSTKYDDANFNVWQSLLSIEFQKLQQTDSVIRHSEEALEMFPNQGILYFYNGAANAADKNYTEAAYSLEQCKQLTANNPELIKYCNVYLGDVYNALEEYEKSDTAYEAVLGAEPTNVYVLNNFSYFLALRQQKLDYANTLSTKLLELDPKNTNYLDTRAWVLYKQGDYKQAKKYLEQAIAQGASSGEVVEHYGDVLFKLGEVDKAVTQWMKAKGMDDTSDHIDKKIAERKLYE